MRKRLYTADHLDISACDWRHALYTYECLNHTHAFVTFLVLDETTHRTAFSIFSFFISYTKFPITDRHIDLCEVFSIYKLHILIFFL